MISYILIPSVSRETPCQKVINCKPRRLETLVQGEHQVTGTIKTSCVWISVTPMEETCEEQIKRLINLRIQFLNCVFYLGLELCFLFQNRKEVCPQSLLPESDFSWWLHVGQG